MTSADDVQSAPSLTDTQIEASAEKLLSDFDAWAQEITRPVPVEVIAEHFLGYELVVSDEGVFADRDCLGGIVFEDELITINSSIENDLGRYSFTVAHEIGHHVLHKEFYFNHLQKDEAKIICREVSNKPMIERQADRFAAALLMPSKTVAAALSSISKGSRPFEKPTTGELRALAAKVVEISGVTNVSNTAMVNRLIDLGLVSGVLYQTGTPQDFYRGTRDIGFNRRTIKWVLSSLRHPFRSLKKLRKSK
jgi:Zn-dependent peptidase ImmA (M78 family)